MHYNLKTSYCHLTYDDHIGEDIKQLISSWALAAEDDDILIITVSDSSYDLTHARETFTKLKCHTPSNSHKVVEHR